MNEYGQIIQWKALGIGDCYTPQVELQDMVMTSSFWLQISGPQRRLTVPQLGEVKGWVSFTSSLVLTLSGSLFLTREPCWGSYGWFWWREANKAWLSNRICNCLRSFLNSINASHLLVLFLFNSHSLHFSPLFLFITLVWFNSPFRPSEASGRTDDLVATWPLVGEFDKWRKRRKMSCKRGPVKQVFFSGTSQIQAPIPVLSEAHAFCTWR